MRCGWPLLLLLQPALATDATLSNFAEKIRGTDLALALFQSTCCGRSKKIIPEWSHVRQLTKQYPAVVFLDVDVDAEPVLAERHDVTTPPLVRVYRGGNVAGHLYTGPPTADGIATFVHAQMQPAVQAVRDALELEDAARKVRALAVHYGDSDSSKGRQAFVAAAIADRLQSGDATARGWVSAPQRLAAHDGVHAPAITLHVYDTDEGRRVEQYNGDFTAEAIHDFMVSAGSPVLAQASPDAFATATLRGLPIAWLIVDSHSPEQATAARRAARRAVAPHRTKMTSLWADIHEYYQLAMHLGLTAHRWPAFALEHNTTKWTFDSRRELTADGLSVWLHDWEGGRVAPSVRSQLEPAVATVNGLTTVVGSTAERLLFGTNRNALVFVHAPWCGYCQALWPEWERTAADLASDSMMVAAIDGTENDVPDALQVEAYPTVALVLAKDRSVLHFEGDRSAETIAEFVRRHVPPPSSSHDGEL